MKEIKSQGGQGDLHNYVDFVFLSECLITALSFEVEAIFFKRKNYGKVVLKIILIFFKLLKIIFN